MCRISVNGTRCLNVKSTKNKHDTGWRGRKAHRALLLRLGLYTPPSSRTASSGRFVGGAPIRISMFDQLTPLTPASPSFAVGASRRPCSVVLPLDFRQAGHLCIQVIPLVVIVRNDPRTTTVAGGGAPSLQQLVQAMAQSKAGKPAGRWQRVEVPFDQEVRRDAQRARQEKVRQEVKLGNLHILSTRRG